MYSKKMRAWIKFLSTNFEQAWAEMPALFLSIQKGGRWSWENETVKIEH